MNVQRRNALIVGSVLALHVAALWALQSGLLRRAVEIVVPVALVGTVMPPSPVTEPKPVQSRPPAPRVTPRQPVPTKATLSPSADAAPRPVAVAPAPASPSVPTGIAESSPMPAVTTPLTPSASPPTSPPAEEAVISASYVENPEPFRCPAAERMGEYGIVMLRVTVGVNGRSIAQSVERSPGSPRLEACALRGIQLQQFKPATRGGKPIEYTHLFPVNYPQKR